MQNLIGDILNWAAAALLFPIMFLPLATLMGGGSKTARATFMWLGLVSTIAMAGVIFVRLAPALLAEPDLVRIAAWLLAIGLVGAAIFMSGGPDRTIPRISKLFETLTRGAGRAVMWLVLAMAIIQFAVVVLRYVFGVNFIFMQESITYMHGALFLLAGGYALITDDHVRVDIFYRAASKKRRAWVDLLGTYFLLLPVCLLLIWAASPYVADSWAVREGSAEASGIQGVFLIKTMIPLFAVLMMMAGFVLAARASEIIRSDRMGG